MKTQFLFRKTVLLFGFMGCCLALFSQNQICVDGSSGGSGDGTPSNPYHTIQIAVEAASNGDVIKVAKGNYSEVVQISQKKVQLLGGFAGGGDFNSANPQTNVTIIEGTDDAPCVLVYMDKQISGALTINGFTIRNGERGIELSGGWSGFLDNITIENNIIENNGTQDGGKRGGGIGLEGNNVTVKNNLIRNNQSGRGAAIAVTDKLNNFLISDNRIENNTGYADHAGGVSICGTGTVTRNIFNGNEAAKNCGYGWGGAILIFGDDNTDTAVTLSHNVYYNNSAPSRGGAVFIDDRAIVQMEHELLYNNTSGESGSAIYVDADWNYNQSTLYMDNCTVSGNNANGAAALFVQGSIAHIQNSIFWNNGKDFEFMDDPPAVATLTVDYTLTQQGFSGTGNISDNPLFANAANGDFHLQSTAGRFDPATGQFVSDGVNSPAIDAGNPTSDFSNEPEPNGGRVNLGCYGNTAEASKSGDVGIEQLTMDNGKLKIYPNPTTGQLHIEYAIYNIEIYDLMGRSVRAYCIRPNGNETETTIDVSHLMPGVYFLKIGNKTAKFVKQ